jgi:urease accessory protein
MNLLLCQLIDSAFPSGGFAHSGGLEASAHHGHVADGAGVSKFARQTLAQAGRGSLPLATAAHGDPRTLPELDRLADLFLSNPVANRASRTQGRALLTGATRSFREAPFSSIEEQVRSGRLGAHYAPIFGAVSAVLDITLADMQRAFLFVTLRGVTSAAVRLGLVGAYEAQEVHARLAPDIDRVIARCRDLTPREIAQTAPLADLVQSTHDRLYTRLFQS